MRRRLGSLLVLVAVGLLPAAAAAQTITGPGCVIDHAPATVTLTNIAGYNTVYSYVIPPGIFQQGARPLHLRMLGNLTTGSPGPAASMAVNYGGATASVTALNAVTLDVVSATPWTLDVWLTPQGNSTTQYLQTKFGYQSATAGTVKTYSTSVAGTTSMASAQALNVYFTWPSASSTNSLVTYNRVLVCGE